MDTSKGVSYDRIQSRTRGTKDEYESVKCEGWNPSARGKEAIHHSASLALYLSTEQLHQ